MLGYTLDIIWWSGWFHQARLYPGQSCCNWEVKVAGWILANMWLTVTFIGTLTARACLHDADECPVCWSSLCCMFGCKLDISWTSETWGDVDWEGLWQDEIIKPSSNHGLWTGAGLWRYDCWSAAYLSWIWLGSFLVHVINKYMYLHQINTCCRPTCAMHWTMHAAVNNLCCHD